MKTDMSHAWVRHLVSAILLLGCSGAGAQVNAGNAEGRATATQVRKDVHVPALRPLDAAPLWNPAGSQDGRTAQYLPYFFPDWRQLRMDVEQRCNRPDPRPDSHVARINLRVEVSSDEYRDAIKTAIGSSSASDDGVAKASANPQVYKFHRLEIHIVNGVDRNPVRKVAEWTPNRIGSNPVLNVTSLGSDDIGPFTITATCGELRDVAANLLLDAFVWTEMHRLEADTASIDALAFFRHKAFLDLNRDERCRGSVISSSQTKDGRVGLAVSGVSLSGGRSGSRLEQKDDRHCLVTENLLTDAYAQYLNQSEVREFVHVGSTPSELVAEMVKQMWSWLDSYEAVLTQTGENQYQLTVGSGEPTPLSSEQAELVFSAARDNSFTQESGGIGDDETEKAELKDKGTLQGSVKGMARPVTVRVYAVGRGAGEGVFSAGHTRIRSVGTMGVLPLRLPRVHYRVGMNPSLRPADAEQGIRVSVIAASASDDTGAVSDSSLPIAAFQSPSDLREAVMEAWPSADLVRLTDLRVRHAGLRGRDEITKEVEVRVAAALRGLLGVPVRERVGGAMYTSYPFGVFTIPIGSPWGSLEHEKSDKPPYRIYDPEGRIEQEHLKLQASVAKDIVAAITADLPMSPADAADVGLYVDWAEHKGGYLVIVVDDAVFQAIENPRIQVRLSGQVGEVKDRGYIDVDLSDGLPFEPQIETSRATFGDRAGRRKLRFFTVNLDPGLESSTN